MCEGMLLPFLRSIIKTIHIKWSHASALASEYLSDSPRAAAQHDGHDVIDSENPRNTETLKRSRLTN